MILEANSFTLQRSGKWVVITSYDGIAVNEDVNFELGNSPDYQLYNTKNDVS